MFYFRLTLLVFIAAGVHRAPAAHGESLAGCPEVSIETPSSDTDRISLFSGLIRIEAIGSKNRGTYFSLSGREAFNTAPVYDRYIGADYFSLTRVRISDISAKSSLRAVVAGMRKRDEGLNWIVVYQPIGSEVAFSLSNLSGAVLCERLDIPIDENIIPVPQEGFKVYTKNVHFTRPESVYRRLFNF